MIKMGNLFVATGILYFLILPTLIGFGIDSRNKHKYAAAVLFGVIFFLFCGLWSVFGPSSSISEIEPMIILILLGMSLFAISKIFERKSDRGVLQRNALMFLAIMVAGLPLYMIRNIVEGRTSTDYPASLLPLIQLTLTLFALVMITNVFEARIYNEKEGRLLEKQELESDGKLDISRKKKYELKAESGFHIAHGVDARSCRADWEDMEPDNYLDKL